MEVYLRLSRELKPAVLKVLCLIWRSYTCMAINWWENCQIGWVSLKILGASIYPATDLKVTSLLLYGHCQITASLNSKKIYIRQFTFVKNLYHQITFNHLLHIFNFYFLSIINLLCQIIVIYILRYDISWLRQVIETIKLNIKWI